MSLPYGTEWQGIIQAVKNLGLFVNQPDASQINGGVHASGSLHYDGRAVDWGLVLNGPVSNLWAIYNSVLPYANHPGSPIVELFWDPSGSGWKNGEDIGPIGGHSDHVHIGVAPGVDLAAEMSGAPTVLTGSSPPATGGIGMGGTGSGGYWSDWQPGFTVEHNNFQVLYAMHYWRATDTYWVPYGVAFRASQDQIDILPGQATPTNYDSVDGAASSMVIGLSTYWAYWSDFPGPIAPMMPYILGGDFNFGAVSAQGSYDYYMNYVLGNMTENVDYGLAPGRTYDDISPFIDWSGEAQVTGWEFTDGTVSGNSDAPPWIYRGAVAHVSYEAPSPLTLEGPNYFAPGQGAGLVSASEQPVKVGPNTYTATEQELAGLTIPATPNDPGGLGFSICFHLTSSVLLGDLMTGYPDAGADPGTRGGGLVSGQGQDQFNVPPGALVAHIQYPTWRYWIPQVIDPCVRTPNPTPPSEANLGLGSEGANYESLIDGGQVPTTVPNAGG